MFLTKVNATLDVRGTIVFFLVVYSTVSPLQITNSHYETKPLKTYKNLLVLSKSLLVIVART